MPYIDASDEDVSEPEDEDAPGEPEEPDMDVPAKRTRSKARSNVRRSVESEDEGPGNGREEVKKETRTRKEEKRNAKALPYHEDEDATTSEVVVKPKGKGKAKAANVKTDIRVRTSGNGHSTTKLLSTGPDDNYNDVKHVPSDIENSPRPLKKLKSTEFQTAQPMPRKVRQQPTVTGADVALAKEIFSMPIAPDASNVPDAGVMPNVVSGPSDLMQAGANASAAPTDTGSLLQALGIQGLQMLALQNPALLQSLILGAPNGSGNDKQ